MCVYIRERHTEGDTHKSGSQPGSSSPDIKWMLNYNLLTDWLVNRDVIGETLDTATDVPLSSSMPWRASWFQTPALHDTIPCFGPHGCWNLTGLCQCLLSVKTLRSCPHQSTGSIHSGVNIKVTGTKTFLHRAKVFSKHHEKRNTQRAQWPPRFILSLESHTT